MIPQLDSAAMDLKDLSEQTPRKFILTIGPWGQQVNAVYVDNWHVQDGLIEFSVEGLPLLSFPVDVSNWSVTRADLAHVLTTREWLEYGKRDRVSTDEFLKDLKGEGDPEDAEPRENPFAGGQYL